MRWVFRGLAILGAVMVLVVVADLVRDYVDLHNRVGRLQDRVLLDERQMQRDEKTLSDVCQKLFESLPGTTCPGNPF